MVAPANSGNFQSLETGAENLPMPTQSGSGVVAGRNPSMSKSYIDLVKEIEDLKQVAERARAAEMDGVISRIKDAIAAYGLTAADLGLRAKPGPKPGAKPGPKPGPKAGAKPGPKPGRRKGAGKKKPGPKPAQAKVEGSPFTKSKNPVARFRDANGNAWVGRGPRPQWLRDALASGKSLKDFAV
jgi:DNA-binding protein H-NS